MAEGLELAAQLLEVVDLAVEDDAQLAVHGLHGLVAARGEIDDREAGVGEAGLLAGEFALPEAAVVGAAVAQGFERRREGRAGAAEVAGDAAHAGSIYFETTGRA